MSARKTLPRGSNKRKTKIICTIGPATASYDMISKLYQAGMDVVRLNMSHGDPEDCARIIKAIQTLNRKTNHTVPIMLDTQGPEIRTGGRAEGLNLQTGTEIDLVVRGKGDVEESSIQIDYEDFVQQVEVGDRVTVDSGLINLEVLEKYGPLSMRCRVIDGGLLQGKRHVNLPGIRVNLPAITKKDREDILFGIEKEVDYIALSFAREASDVEELRDLLGDKNKKIKVIAKIENQEGLENIEALIKISDGIMVARGDLGVEVDFFEVPSIQRRIVKLCAQYGKRVIVATHLLESMIQNPIPTRAEVTDVANAVHEEADAVMLSGETAVGKYPVKCVQCLDSICRATEKRPGAEFAVAVNAEAQKQNLAASAVHLAESIEAKGIVVITRRGRMANYVTNCHPFKSSIYAFSNDSRTRRQLALNRGVYAFRSQLSSNPEKTLALALKRLHDSEGLRSRDRIVVISDVLEGAGVEAIQIREMPDFSDDAQCLSENKS